jgi:hypothetical protein
MMTSDNISIGAVKRAPRQRRPLRRLWLRVRRPIVNRILHLDDSPHRIALGVFLGFVVGWTPTMGAQIILYLIIAYLLRANRASGVLPVLLTNPLTALPVYVFNWRIGRWILHPGGLSEADRLSQRQAMDQFLNDFHLSRLFDGDFWASVGPTFEKFGSELIVGCLVVGVACGLAGYVATYYGVIVYRRRRAQRRAIAETAVATANKEMAVRT